MKVYKVKVNGKTYKVELEGIDEVTTSTVTPKETKIVEPKKVEAVTPSGKGNEVTSPIQGTISSIKVEVGNTVKKGDVVVVIEAMKLENDVVSTFDGKVTQICVTKGQSVTAKQVLIVVE